MKGRLPHASMFMLEDSSATLSPDNILISIPAPIGVLVADDNDFGRMSLVSMLNREPEIMVLGEAATGVDTIEAAQALGPDIVVMDMSLPIFYGIVVVERIATMKRAPKLLIISHVEEEAFIQDCMRAGAQGYLLKDSVFAELTQAIRVIYDGGHFFSPRIARMIVGFYLKDVVPASQS